MKNLAILFLLCAVVTSAYTQQIPDYYGEEAGHHHTFYQNMGQLLTTDTTGATDVEYYTLRTSPAIYAEADRLSIVFNKIDTTNVTQDSLQKIEMRILNDGENTMTEVSAMEITNDKAHFFFPHISSGVTNVDGYSRLVYPNVYNNIDFHVYSSNLGLKYYFVIMPGGDPNELMMLFQGANTISCPTNGDLEINSLIGGLTFQKARAFQINMSMNAVQLSWQPDYFDVGGGKVQLSNFGSYNTMLPLVIQMDRGQVTSASAIGNLEWSTYFGGNTLDEIYDIAVDQSNNQYVTGYTLSSNFPVLNAYQGNNAGGNDILISKFNNSHELEYSTYYGGSNTDEGRAISVSDLGKIAITGYTFSSDFPTINLSGAYNDASINTTSAELYIGEFNNLLIPLWVTFFGGSGEQRGYDIQYNSLDELYVVGSIDEHVAEPFPTTTLTGAYNQGLFGGGITDGFITQFNPNRSLKWSTFFGGNGGDIAIALVPTSTGFTVAGRTNSTNFPIVDPGGGAYNQSVFAGGTDITLSSFDQNSNLIWSTYYGGSDIDQLGFFDCITATTNEVYISGFTQSIDFPMLDPGGSSYFQGTNGGSEDGFLISFDNSFSHTWGTYFGGVSLDQVLGIASDDQDRIYVTGTTNSNDFPLLNFTTYYNQSTLGGSVNVYGDDSYISEFINKESTWSTYFGGGENSSSTNGLEIGYSIDTYKDFYVYMAGATSTFNNQFSTANFIPLEDPGNNAYFNDNFGAGIAKGLIAKFNIGGPPTDNEEINNLQKVLHIFPNPTNGNFLIGSSNGQDIQPSNVKVFNSIGQQIAVSFTKIQGNLSVNMNNSSSGFYSVVISTDQNKEVLKLVKY